MVHIVDFIKEVCPSCKDRAELKNQVQKEYADCHFVSFAPPEYLTDEENPGRRGEHVIQELCEIMNAAGPPGSPVEHNGKPFGENRYQDDDV